VAIYHFSAKIVSRSQGQSSVAKAAYNSRSLLENEQTGERHDYRYKGEVLFSGIFAPKNAPDWVKDREALWSAVEKRETRKNSQLAREIEMALPHELTGKQREFLVKDFVRENFVRKGMVADVAIHGPDPGGDDRNYHAHILLTMREIGPEGFGAKMRELNGRAQLEDWREKWERLANRHLERHGHEARIDRRTLEAQGIDREPTVHLGHTASQFEREGVQTERGDLNREIVERNREREQLKREADQLEAQRSRTEGFAESVTLKKQERQIARDIDKGLTKTAPRLLKGATKALDGALDFLVGAPPETPEQRRAKAAEKVERAKEAEQKAKETPPKTVAEVNRDLWELHFTHNVPEELRTRSRYDDQGRERERERD